MRDILRRFRHLFGHLSQSIRSQYGGGLTGVGKFVYYTCLKWNRFGVFQLYLGAGAGAPFAVPGYTFMELKPAALDRYRNDVSGLSKEFYADRAHDVSLCHAVLHGNELVYVHWVFLAGARSRFLSLGRDVAEIGYIATLPEHRRRGLCAAALGEAFLRLKQRGVRQVCTVVHSDNVASRRAMQRAGMTEEAAVHALGPFNMRLQVGVPCQTCS